MRTTENIFYENNEEYQDLQSRIEKARDKKDKEAVQTLIKQKREVNEGRKEI